MSGRLDGKRAIITGAASGIGRAAAAVLAGARVGIIVRQENEEQRRKLL